MSGLGCIPKITPQLAQTVEHVTYLMSAVVGSSPTLRVIFIFSFADSE